MIDRIALVTGAGKPQGLGFAVARAAEIGSRARPEALDVTDVVAIAALAARTPQLDILSNNAAVLSPCGELAATADLVRVRARMEAKLFVPRAVAQSFLTALRQSPAGRIVNVSSGPGSHVDPVFGLASGNGMSTGYAVSRAALNALTAKLAREEPSLRLRINAV